MKKRALSLFLALVLCLGLMPVSVFAAEDGSTTGDTTGDTTGETVTEPETPETPKEPEEPETPTEPTVTLSPANGSSITVYAGDTLTTSVEVTNATSNNCALGWDIDASLRLVAEDTQETSTSSIWTWRAQNVPNSSGKIYCYMKNQKVGEISVTIVRNPREYDVFFDSNGGSGQMTSLLSFVGKYTLPECTFRAPTGKEFKCWATNAGGTGTTYQPGDKEDFTKNTTFYAIWQDIPNMTPENPGTTPETPSGGSIYNGRMYLWTTNYRQPMGSSLKVDLYGSSNPSVSVHLDTTEGLVANRNPVIRWTVEDSSVARIYERSHGGPNQASKTVDSPINNISLTIGDPSVVICPRKAGSTRITAQLYEISPLTNVYGPIGEAELAFTLTVDEGDVPRITIAPQSVSLKAGEKKEVTVTLSEGQFDNPWLIFPEAGDIEKLINITSKNSSDNRVCTLTLEGKASGTADLNLYLSRGRGAAIPSTKQTCRVTVTGGSQNTVTVSFNSNGGSSVSSKTVTVGETYGTLSTPTRSGYTFNGWYTSRTGGSEVTSSTKVTETSNHTLYAHWTQGKPVTVTVYFSSNGGSSVSDKTVTVGERYGSLSTPTREGYTFDGWYTSRTGGSEVTSSTTVTQTSSHTLYAHWTQVKPGQITVSFDSNGGSSVSSRAVTPNETYGTLPTPTREGYTFEGWYTAAAGGSKVTSSTRVTETSNHTLYAHWTKLETTTGEQPSAWAKADVERAAELGILAQELQDKYRQPITRAEFCSLADLLWSKVTGSSAAAQTVSFTDTDDAHVLNMAAEGIVSGVGDSRFSPDGQLTREQAAVILVRLADTINDRGGKEHVVPAGTAAFADNGSISGWALEAVGRVQAGGVMSGVGENMFSPKGNYTREQAVITVMRIYDLLEN